MINKCKYCNKETNDCRCDKCPECNSRNMDYFIDGEECLDCGYYKLNEDKEK